MLVTALNMLNQKKQLNYQTEKSDVEQKIKSVARKMYFLNIKCTYITKLNVP